jgi:hypothetical protein
MIAAERLPGIRLSLRLSRFELGFLGIVVALVVSASFGVAAQLDALAPPAVCFEPYEFAPPEGCEAASSGFYELQNRFGGPLLGLLVAVPLLAGAILGVTIVAREVERGTARLAWSVTTSRVRWYAVRLLPTLLVFGAIAFAAGVAADRLEGAVRPGMDMTTSFDGFGNRGVIVAGRAVFVFAIAVVVGAVMGRVLPALLVTVVIAAVGIAGGTAVHQQWLRGEAVVLEDFDWQAGDLYVDQRFRLPDGSLVRWDHFEGGEPPYDVDGMPIYPEVVLGIPGERYWAVQWREMGALLGASFVALAAAAVITNRRRPG